MNVEIKLIDTKARDYSADVANLYMLAGWLECETKGVGVNETGSGIDNRKVEDANAAGQSSDFKTSAAHIAATHSAELDYTRRTLENSYCCFGAFDGEKLIGFFRAISDGVSDAYLLELFVMEQYRHRGIGEKLCREIVAYLKSKNIGWITCISTREGLSVYKKIGKEMDFHTPFKF